MTTSPLEVYQEMCERCDWATTMQQRPNQESRAAAIGAVIQTLAGGFLAVEAGMTPDGLAYVSARVFDEHGEPLPVGVLELDDSVMLTG